MLVLTRKIGEKILIGDDITVTVIDIGASRLKVGIEAPAGHRILRSELVAEPEQRAAGRRDGEIVVQTKTVPGRRSRRGSSAEVAGVSA